MRDEATNFARWSSWTVEPLLLPINADGPMAPCDEGKR